MLMHIPEVIAPELMKAMMEMGHGDELTIGDINFPAVSRSTRAVNARGIGACELLEAILTFLPLDAYHDCCVMLMDPGDFFHGEESPLWARYRRIIRANDPCGAFRDFRLLEAPAFYERAQKSFVTVASSERAAYGCLILRKGAVV